jgi:ubiquitin carboxyl-terminal hydrolase 5/13
MQHSPHPTPLHSLQAHDSAAKADNVAAWEEEQQVSKYADSLPQLDSGRRIDPDPSSWRCDETGTTENLWLNLSTGFIGSGRPVGAWPGCGARLWCC